MAPRELLEQFERQPRGRADFKHLTKQLGARGPRRRALQQALDRLTSEGRLIEYKKGHYALPGKDSDLVAGRFLQHRDGFGFVVADTPLAGVQGDIYVRPHATGGAMNDDRVLVRLLRVIHGGRAEGRVQRVLRRTHVEVVGAFHHSKYGCYVIPHDQRIGHHVVIPEGSELPPAEVRAERLGKLAPPEVETAEQMDGMIVNVEVTRFPSRLEEAQGRVIEILGRPGDFGIDVEIIIRKFHLPHRFPDAVRHEVEAVPDSIDPREIRRRRDFRDYDIVTIDDEAARDFDDAVWVDLLDNGHFALHVHIADVSHYVEPGTALDREGNRRGTSTYFPDRAVPMLPAELSTGICSLNPRVDRLVLSALLEIDHGGNTVRAEFCRGVIRSVERMTYTNVNRVLMGDAELRTRYQPLAERFGWMRDLAMILNRRRRRRGSIDFDLPAPEITFDEFGEMTGIVPSERNIAHRIIEEFMLAANEAVAGRLEQECAASLYRVHEPPDPGRILEFEQLAATFGHSLGVDIPLRRLAWTQRRRDGSKRRQAAQVAASGVEVSPRHYQKLIKRLSGKPEERILSYLMLRSLKQARYSEANSGHFALAAPTYTHFTSPIRRYPDLVVHRLLGDWLDLGPQNPSGDKPAPGPYHESDLAVIARETSFTERRAADAERALIDWKKARFMEAHLGDEFGAIVIQVTKAGLIIELTDLFIEGFVPLESLPGRFQYRENLRALINPRTKQKFGLGDRVDVLAVRVPYGELRPEFSWIPPEKPRVSES